MATLIDGTTVANNLLDDVHRRADAFAERTGRRQALAAVLVGDDPASAAYVKMKRNRSRRNGIDPTTVVLAPTRPPRPPRSSWPRSRG